MMSAIGEKCDQRAEAMTENSRQTFGNAIASWVGRSIGKLYWLLFGWLDILIANRREREFARDIREGLFSIFQKYGAEIVPNDARRVPPPLDYAVVTVAIGHLLLRFVRRRGEFGIDVAAKGKILSWRDWKDITTVRMVLDESKESQQAIRLRSVSDADRLLQIEIPRLLDATSDEHWDLVKRKANALFPAPVRVR
jgi:hypothetical protein